jgi:hypothetical protein
MSGEGTQEEMTLRYTRISVEAPGALRAAHQCRLMNVS